MLSRRKQRMVNEKWRIINRRRESEVYNVYPTSTPSRANFPVYVSELAGTKTNNHS